MIDLSRWVWTGTCTADDIEREALALCGTPFVPHGRLFGIGVDCIGLGVLVCRACAIVAPDADITGYPMVPDGTLLDICDSLLIRSKNPHVAGMGVFVMGGSQAHHLGIYVPYAPGVLAIVHAVGPGGRNQVIKTRMLSSMRFVRSYTVPGVR